MIMRKISLMDKNKSCLSSREVKKYKKEITKQINSPVCANMSTNDVANVGVAAMKKDNFCMVKVKLDV